MVLTVVIRDDGPLVFCGDVPSYRTVRIDLTTEQEALIDLREVGVNCGQAIHEQISRAILEPGATRES
jgi:hypothetical protein